jgi:hypothetical protein
MNVQQKATLPQNVIIDPKLERKRIVKTEANIDPKTLIEPDNLLLDPNNYRFLDIDGYRAVSNRARYAEPGVQERALALLQTTKSFELDALKDSIKTNGFIPLEQIVVEPYPSEEKPTHYLVVEGNRRVAAVRSLLTEQRGGGSDIPAENLKTLEKLPAIIITGSVADRAR